MITKVVKGGERKDACGNPKNAGRGGREVGDSTWTGPLPYMILKMAPFST
jgi:hypothetical protein